MKRLLSYFIFVLLFLACGKRSDSVTEQHPLPFAFDGKLLAIDSLMQHDADSALQMLLSFRAERGTSSDINANYQALLTSEALYKTYNPQYYRNELQSAMRFFDSLSVQYPYNDDIMMLSARSHYMNGVGYYESDSVVEACKEYLKTLEIMEDHFDTETLTGYRAKFMGLTYTRLGELLYNNYLSFVPLESYKKAFHYYNKLNNYNLANPYRNIASSYYLDHQPDSALFYYRKARLIAKVTNKPFVYSATLSESAPVYYDLGYSDSAFMMIKEALMQPINEDARLAQYHTLGYLYYKESLYDSAIIYLEQSIKRNSYATQTSSSELLMNCYQALGDTVKASYYKGIYGNYFSKYSNNAEITTELTKLYDDYQQKRLDKDNILKRRRQNRIFSIVIVVVLLLIAGIIVISRIKVRKTIDKSINDLAIKDKALADLKRRFGTNSFINEPICNYIWKVVAEHKFKAKIDYKVYKDYALDKNKIIMLKDAVDRHYNNFTQTLVKLYPELTVDDIDYCCLYLLGLKDTDISALMQRAYPTVHQRSNKLKHIFNTKESLQSTISAMVSESHYNI